MKTSPKCLKGFFYIERKLKLRCLAILWKSRWVRGLWTWKSWGKGCISSFWNSGGKGGGQKTVPSVVGVWIFSGITQCLQNLWFTTFQVCYFSSMLRSRNERSHAQRCFSWNQEGGTVNCKRKCKQQTIQVIKLCLSCVLLSCCSLLWYQGVSMWLKCGDTIGLSLDEL